MSNHQNSASIHRHFHYHYHYDVSNQPNEHAENYSTRSSVSPKHGNFDLNLRFYAKRDALLERQNKSRSHKTL